MPIRDDQGALQCAGEECQSPVCGAGIGESGDGETAGNPIDEWLTAASSIMNLQARLENGICSRLP